VVKITEPTPVHKLSTILTEPITSAPAINLIDPADIVASATLTEPIKASLKIFTEPMPVHCVGEPFI